MTPNRRRKYLIDRKFQIKYVLLVISVLTLYTLSILSAIFVPHAAVLYLDLPLSIKAEAADILLMLNKDIWPAVTVVMALFGILSVFLTHKMAGPVFAIEKMVREMASGNLTQRVKLRKRDDFHDLEVAVNELAERLEALMFHIDVKSGNVDAELTNIRKRLQSAVSEDGLLMNELSSLEENIRIIRETINQFNFKGNPKQGTHNN